jgi:hypothetical protein
MINRQFIDSISDKITHWILHRQAGQQRGHHIDYLRYITANGEEHPGKVWRKVNVIQLRIVTEKYYNSFYYVV